MKILFYIFISIAFMLVTFFGLGPVLFADGSMGERLITLAAVIFLYLLLIWSIILFAKHQRNTKK